LRDELFSDETYANYCNVKNGHVNIAESLRSVSVRDRARCGRVDVTEFVTIKFLNR
jgi:hypothetical protein